MSKFKELFEDTESDEQIDFSDSFEDPVEFEMLSMYDIITDLSNTAGLEIAEQFKQFSCFSSVPQDPVPLIQLLSIRTDYFSKQCLEKLMEKTNASR
jgi:hypothetical protein